MSKVAPVLLNDTLNLIQLARETALAGGKTEQAKRLTPVVNEMRGLVTSSREVKSTPTQAAGQAGAVAPNPGIGVMGNSDFRSMLQATAKPAAAASTAPAAGINSTEKNQIVAAMAQGGMSDLDIARQMGMTRDEVQMIISIHGS